MPGVGKKTGGSSAKKSLGYLLAKASQRWNEALYAEFCEAGFAHVRPSYGSVLVPLFQNDGLRLSELGQRAGLSKQTMTTMIPQMEKAGLVKREPDPEDGRATLVYLTEDARNLRPVAEKASKKIHAGFTADIPSDVLELIRDWLESVSM